MSDRVTELARRRGFFFGSSEIYGGVAGFYTYGPQGAALKDNVEDAWRDRFTIKQDNFEIEAPTVMHEPVFEASGHLEGFDDMLVECPDCGVSHRADHLIEDATGIDEAESLPISEIETLVDEHDLACPNCGTPLAGQAVENFNLMFETSIGPGSGQPGYLRPETAQGIFVEFPRLKEYARNQLPFGVTQIGRSYRNEISPRKGLVRTREFTQAELEQFIDPERDEPPLSDVADVEVRLYPAARQESEENSAGDGTGSPTGDDAGSATGDDAGTATDERNQSADAESEQSGYVETTIGAAVESGLIGDPWVGYYLGLAQQWYERVGVDTERFRFRQHLPGELAHYAADCWDAESEIGAARSTSGGRTNADDGGDVDLADPTAGGWIEIAGFAYRGDYDLRKHAEHSDEDFTVFRQYDEPITVERAVVDPDMSVLGPEFGGAAGDVAEAIERRARTEPDAFEDETVTVDVDGDSYSVDVEHTNFRIEEQTESGEHVTPHVVEPSFGVDRLVYTLIVHAFEIDEIEGEKRTYLSMAPGVAPTDVGVFPLVSNVDALVERAEDVVEMLRDAGLSVTYDESGNIGRRYRRQDEIGTPFCVTIDRDGLEESGADTATVRDRDSLAQVRVPIDQLPEELTALRDGTRRFHELLDRYEAVAEQ